MGSQRGVQTSLQMGLAASRKSAGWREAGGKGQTLGVKRGGRDAAGLLPLPGVYEEKSRFLSLRGAGRTGCVRH